MTERIHAKPATADRINVSVPTLERMVRSGQFPRPIQISPRRVGWTESAIVGWIASRTPKAAS